MSPGHCTVASLRFRLLVLLGMLVGFGPGGTGFAASTVRLKNGGAVTGEVLSRKTDRVIVDLGFTVVSVPADEIDHIAEAGIPGAPAVTAETGADLYRLALNPPALSVKENAGRCAEAVVQVRTPIGLGSGFVINSEGYVVTNEHVIAGEYQITVTLYQHGPGGLQNIQFKRVRIVALDAAIDLALLKIEDGADRVFPTVPLGDSDALNEGQTVFAIGSPLGLERTVSEGIVSLRSRAMDGQLYIQTTTQINPGNSGGPLLNLRGEIVGVTNMKAMMAGVEGLSFAIPTATVKGFLRNRDAFAFDPRNANSGYRYLDPPKPVGVRKP